MPIQFVMDHFNKELAKETKILFDYIDDKKTGFVSTQKIQGFTDFVRENLGEGITTKKL